MQSRYSGLGRGLMLCVTDYAMKPCHWRSPVRKESFTGITGQEKTSFGKKTVPVVIQMSVIMIILLSVSVLVLRSPDGRVSSVEATLNLDNKVNTQVL